MIWFYFLRITVCIKLMSNTTNIYLFKVNYRNTIKGYEICPKLTIKTPKQSQWGPSSIFIVNFEHISHPFRVFLLTILNRQILAGNKTTESLIIMNREKEEFFIWLKPIFTPFINCEKWTKNNTSDSFRQLLIVSATRRRRDMKIPLCLPTSPRKSLI